VEKGLIERMNGLMDNLPSKRDKVMIYIKSVVLASMQ
jgi:hypothetical protein